MKVVYTLFFILITTISLRAETFTIEASNFQFNPDQLSVQQGDTILFKWIEGTHPVQSETGAWETFTLSSGNTERIIVINEPGDYSYICTFHVAQGMTGNITVGGTSTIETDLVKDVYRLYPNPSENIINIDLTNPQVNEISVYNMLGKEVFSISPYENELQINMTNLPVGIYFIVLKDNTRIIDTGRIIKR